MRKFLRKTAERLLSDATDREGYSILKWKVNFKDLLESKKLRLASIAMVMTFFFALAASNFQICYAVTLNGESVGSAGSKEELRLVLDRVESEASEILGDDGAVEEQMDQKLEITTSISTRPSTTDELKDSLLGTINGISELYAVYVDETLIGAVSEQATVYSVLNDITNQYAEEDTSAIYFGQNITVEKEFVSDDAAMDEAELRAALDPANGVLTVKAIKVLHYTQPVDYDTQYVDDDTMYEDETALVSAGTQGEASVMAYALYENGEPVGNTIMNTEVTKEPVDEVVAVGTKEFAYIWPAEGYVSSYFGPRSVSVGSSNHKGIDICGKSGSNILAAASGEVIYAGWMSGYGNFVQIQHENGEVTCYGHNSSLNVSVGQHVERGDVIAYMGRTGVASGVHCHFEIRVNGTQVDPMPYLPEK